MSGRVTCLCLWLSQIMSNETLQDHSTLAHDSWNVIKNGGKLQRNYEQYVQLRFKKKCRYFHLFHGRNNDWTDTHDQTASIVSVPHLLPSRASVNVVWVCQSCEQMDLSITLSGGAQMCRRCWKSRGCAEIHEELHKHEDTEDEIFTRESCVCVSAQLLLFLWNRWRYLSFK